MDQIGYEQFKELEEDHWWFQGRRAIFFSVLDRFMMNGATADGGHSPNAKILDIGCAMGGMLPDLSRYGSPVGFDYSVDSLKFCQERGFQKVTLGDGGRLPFADDALDLVTLFDTVEHIDDDRAVLREAFRVTTPGGLIMVTVPAYQFLFSDNDLVAHHKRRYTAGELKAKLREAGYTLKKTSYYNTVLFPMIVPIVLLRKLKMRIFGVPDAKVSNLSYATSNTINAFLSAAFSSERIPMRVISYPVGHSLLCVARKPS